MKVTFLAADVGTPTSGTSRFAINIARGVRRLGHDVAIAALSIEPGAAASLRENGVVAVARRRSAYPMWRQASYLTPFSRVGRSVADLAMRSVPADRYVVLSDAAIDAIDVLEGKPTVYLSNGEITMMLLSPSFFSTNGTTKWVISRMMASVIRQNAARARRYSRLLANSEFTRNFMSFLYGAMFSGVVYPPVELDAFRPAAELGAERYALAVARNENEQGLRILSHLAPRIPLHVVGGAAVPGAVALGVVSEERLRAEYAAAQLLLFPIISEFFGYAVAESLASGTPVLAFDCGGPSELVKQGESGWLVRDEAAFVREAEARFGAGTTPEMRAAARRCAARLSLDSVARELTRYLTEI